MSIDHQIHEIQKMIAAETDAIDRAREQRRLLNRQLRRLHSIKRKAN